MYQALIKYSLYFLLFTPVVYTATASSHHIPATTHSKRRNKFSKRAKKRSKKKNINKKKKRNKASGKTKTSSKGVDSKAVTTVIGVGLVLLCLHEYMKTPPPTQLEQDTTQQEAFYDLVVPNFEGLPSHSKVIHHWLRTNGQEWSTFPS